MRAASERKDAEELDAHPAASHPEAPYPASPYPASPSLRSFPEEEIERPRKLDYSGRAWEENPRHKAGDLLARIPLLSGNPEAYAYVQERLALGEWGRLAGYLEEEVLPALDPGGEDPAGTPEDHLRAKEALRVAQNVREGEAY